MSDTLEIQSTYTNKLKPFFASELAVEINLEDEEFHKSKPERKLVKCDLCNYQSDRRHNVKQHYARKHLGVAMPGPGDPLERSNQNSYNSTPIFAPEHAAQARQGNSVAPTVIVKEPDDQAFKIIGDKLLMEKYEILPGILKKAFTDKSKSQSFVVQVLSVRSRHLQISDGLHSILNCIAYCDIKDISAAINPIIRITQWSLVQMIRTDGSSPGTSDKPQYGMRLDQYSVVENHQPLPIIGRPKVIKVTIFKDPNLELQSIVNFYLKHLNLINENTNKQITNPASESFQHWAKIICQRIRQADNGWVCGICRVFLAANITANVVSHIQKHYREFPGYRCPKLGCYSPNLQAFQEHLNRNICQDTIVETLVPIKKSDTEVPHFDMDVYESPVKANEELVNEVSTSILKSLDSHFLSSEQNTSSSFEELWKDFSGKINENQEKVATENDELVSLKEDENSKIISLEEYDPIPVNESDVSHILSSVQDTSPSFEELWKDFSDKINEDQEEAAAENNQMLSLEETDTADESEDENNKIFTLEKNDPIPVNESDDQNNKEIGLKEMDPISVEESNDLENSPPSKKIKILNSYSDVSQSQSNWHEELRELINSSQPFNWNEEMGQRVRMKGKSFLCVECGFKTSGGGHKSMINHLETVHMNHISAKCPECDLVCDSFMNFNEHMKIAHKVKFSLLQKDSTEEKISQEASFSYINDSIEMQENNSNPFDWEEEVRKRIRRVSKIFICDECGFKTNSTGGQKALIHHIDANHMKNISGYRCPDCNILCDTFQIFNQHMSICHNVHMNILQNSSLFL